MMLGGRVAEEIACDDITTGASNDLERATKMAKQMVTRYGMSEALGTQVFGEANHEVFLGRDYSATPDYSQQTANRIDEEVARIMNTAHDRAVRILTENRAQLDLMAQVLIERETVEGEAVKALLDNKWDEYLAKEAEDKRRAAEEAAKAAQEGLSPEGSSLEDRSAETSPATPLMPPLVPPLPQPDAAAIARAKALAEARAAGAPVPPLPRDAAPTPAPVTRDQEPTEPLDGGNKGE